jgi:hypothetical protein
MNVLLQDLPYALRTATRAGGIDCSGSAGRDALHHRHCWDGCILGQQAFARHRWMQLMDRCALALSRRAGQSAATTCSSRPTRLHLVTRSSPITKRNLRVSRTFNYRIGCAKRRMPVECAVEYQA